MRRVAIQDANILIDLVNIGLFAHCLSLDFKFCTTQLIFESELNEMQTATIRVHIESEEFEIIKISAEELLEIQMTKNDDKRLSEQDWSAIYYAQKFDALLLSGDKILRKVAEAKMIEVRGILWVFDLLVDSHVISNTEAVIFLGELVKRNRRLPAKECRKRLELWRAIDQ